MAGLSGRIDRGSCARHGTSERAFARRCAVPHCWRLHRRPRPATRCRTIPRSTRRKSASSRSIPRRRQGVPEQDRPAQRLSRRQPALRRPGPGLPQVGRIAGCLHHGVASCAQSRDASVPGAGRRPRRPWRRSRTRSLTPIRSRPTTPTTSATSTACAEARLPAAGAAACRAMITAYEEVSVGDAHAQGGRRRAAYGWRPPSAKEGWFQAYHLLRSAVGDRDRAETRRRALRAAPARATSRTRPNGSISSAIWWRR